MQIVAILSFPHDLGESLRIAQRVYKTGHEVLNLDLIHCHEAIIHRTAQSWEQTYTRLCKLADAVIVFRGLEQANPLTAELMQENIPVFLSFEEWLTTLSD